MKAQYQIDQFVKFKDESGTESTGVIEATLQTNEGFSYRMADSVTQIEFIPERNIIQAYRPVTKRKQSKKTVNAKSVRTSRKPATQETAATN